MPASPLPPVTECYKFLTLKKEEINSVNGPHVWKVGDWYEVTLPLTKCSNGFHASEKPLDAYGYTQGDVLAPVEIGGEVLRDVDKVCAQKMRLISAGYWTDEDSKDLAIFAAGIALEYVRSGAYAHASKFIELLQNRKTVNPNYLRNAHSNSSGGYRQALSSILHAAEALSDRGMGYSASYACHYASEAYVIQNAVDQIGSRQSRYDNPVRDKLNLWIKARKLKPVRLSSKDLIINTLKTSQWNAGSHFPQFIPLLADDILKALNPKTIDMIF